MNAAPLSRFVEGVLLVAAALAPLAFLVSVSCSSTGRDLAPLFHRGATLLFAMGVMLVVVGCWWGRRGWKWSGAASLVCLVLTVLASGSGMHYIGSETVTLEVTVRDAESRQPVPNASVRLFAYKENTSSGPTDSAGRVSLKHALTTVGPVSLTRNTGCYYLWKETLEVEAEGSESISTRLTKFTEPVWNLYGPPLPALEVALKRKPGRR
jgi:hypothetical protein